MHLGCQLRIHLCQHLGQGMVQLLKVVEGGSQYQKKSLEPNPSVTYHNHTDNRPQTTDYRPPTTDHSHTSHRLQ